MKTFKEFIAESDKNIEYPFKNKNVKVVDDDYINLQPTTKSPGGKFAGTTSWGSQRVWADLWMLKPSELSGISLKPNEYVFRYTSNVTQIAGLAPMIKINVDKGLVYFLTDEAKELDKPMFETRGTKLNWLTIHKGSLKR